MEPTFNADWFEVVILDEDRRLFSIAGLMPNDSELDRQVQACQKAGRKIRYELVDKSIDKQRFIAELRQKTGFSPVQDAFESPSLSSSGISKK